MYAKTICSYNILIPPSTCAWAIVTLYFKLWFLYYFFFLNILRCVLIHLFNTKVLHSIKLLDLRLLLLQFIIIVTIINIRLV